MATGKTDTTCAITCWIAAALVGAFSAVALMVLGWSFMQGVFMGGLALVVIGLVLTFGMCGRLASPNEAGLQVRREMDAARAEVQGGAPAPSAAAPAAAAPSPAPAPAHAPEPAAEPAASAPESASGSTLLAGEEELAQRKGDWKYESGAAPAPAAAPAASAPAASDGGDQPAGLDGPRGGKADDLKKISGVGPALEKALNELGYFHFDQIAAWTESEVAWVDDNLIRFKGRVTRDNWVEQARVLAAGG